MLGYSIGGKVALKLIELFPDEMKDVFLFAPDGIKISFWYRFVTRTDLGKWVYKRLMLHPSRYMRIVNAFESIRIVPSHTANFVRNSLDTAAKREMVYQTWMCLRHMDPDTGKVCKIINERNLNFHLYFGKYDKVIPQFIGERFVRGLRNKKSLHILDAGHQLIKEKTNAELEKILSV